MTRTRIRTRYVAGLLVVLVALAAARGSQLPAESSPPSTPTAGTVERPAPREHRGKLGEADGAVPAGTTVFDDDVPGVANLEPALLSALREAANAASADGVRFVVDSGWRSAEYQAHLVDEAVAKYGSEAEAARWVASPETSEHVSGNAIDLGPVDATTWLSSNGARYGLCRIYDNEPWHYELRPDAIEQGCPPTYADPTHDPRMQR